MFMSLNDKLGILILFAITYKELTLKKKKKNAPLNRSTKLANDTKLIYYSFHSIESFCNHINRYIISSHIYVSILLKLL